jgi:Kef-type K+ transport system membrane component KefB
VLGVVLAFFLFSQLAAPGTSFVAFALFIGIAMSITAFPVLARILQDNNMASSPIGLMALSCAAVDDVTAWCILAFIVAIAQASGLAASFLHLGLVIIYIGFMAVIGRRMLIHHFTKSSSFGDPTATNTLALIILLVIASALWAEAIGIHALFGAFIVGLILPKEEKFTKSINVQIENLSNVLLVPLFFVFTGLRTEIGLLGEPLDWVFTLAIIVLATLGKLGGCALAARMSGMSWNDSLQLGTLMNTRGLMELIVLNIGLDLGIFSQRLFTMFVIMALVTTILTGPLLNFIRSRQNTALASSEDKEGEVIVR